MAGLGDMFGASLATVNGQKPRNSNNIQSGGFPSGGDVASLASKIADFLPVVGGVKGAYEEGKQGNYGMSALNAATVPLDLVSGGLGGALLKAGLLAAVKPTEKLFHGSLGAIKGDLRAGTGSLGDGFYLTNKENQAALYPKLHAMRQGIKNPDVVVTPMETSARNIYNFDEVGLPASGVDANKLKSLGYDGATYNNELIVFDPTKVNTVINTPKLTEFEQRHLTAQKNAALPVEQGGLGLPVDNTAMDRAMAQNYEDVYRGTSADESAVRVGNYVTGSPEYADKFATIEGGNFMPLMMKKGKEYKPDNQSIIEQARNNPELIDSLKADGYDSMAWVSNSRRDRGASGWGDDKSQFVILNPANIRSRFAAFDPMRRHEADLLGNINPQLAGALGATGIGAAYGATQLPEEYKSAIANAFSGR